MMPWKTARVGNCCMLRVSVWLCERFGFWHRCRSSFAPASRSNSLSRKEFRSASGSRSTNGAFSQFSKSILTDSRRPTAFTIEGLAGQFGGRSTSMPTWRQQRSGSNVTESNPSQSRAWYITCATKKVQSLFDSLSALNRACHFAVSLSKSSRSKGRGSGSSIQLFAHRNELPHSEVR